MTNADRIKKSGDWLDRFLEENKKSESEELWER